MSYSSAGVRSLSLDWHGEGGGLNGTYSQVTEGADWIDGEASC